MPTQVVPQGIRKAAVLVASLDPKTAEVLLARMGPQQAQRVRQAAGQIRAIDPEEQEEVLGEFRRLGLPLPQQRLPGIELDGDLARRLAAADSEAAPDAPPPTPRPGGMSSRPGGMPSRSVGMLSGSGTCSPDASRRESPPPSEPPFRFLRETELEKLAKILATERPQVIALVLSHLPPPSAGAILSRLAPPAQADVVRRLVNLEETDPETLREVECGLERRLSEQVSMQRRRVAGLSAVTAILHAAEPRVGMTILDNLGQHDPGLMERLAPPRLDFADLMELDDRTLATTMGAADPEIVVMALVGAPPEWLDRLLAYVPQQEARRIRFRLDHFGPIRLSDVDEARRRLAELATRLAREGRIELPRTMREAMAA